MIFFEYASPMPGSVCSSSADALLMSTGPCFVSPPGFDSVLSDLAGGALLACAEIAPGRAVPRANRNAMTSATARTMGASSVEIFIDRDGVDDYCHHTISARKTARTRLSGPGGRGIKKTFGVERADAYGTATPPARIARAGCGAQAGVAQGPCSGRTELPPAAPADARSELAHGVRGSPLPEHRRMLGGSDGDLHDS